MKKLLFIALIATVAVHASDAPKGDDAKLQALIAAGSAGQTDSDAKKAKLTEAATNAASALPRGYDQLKGACLCAVVAQDTTEQQAAAFSKAPARVATLNYKDIFGDSSDGEDSPVFLGSDDEDPSYSAPVSSGQGYLTTAVLTDGRVQSQPTYPDNKDEPSPTFSVPDDKKILIVCPM